MQTTTPSAEQVRAALQPLSMKQLARLSELSGVPSTTLYKIKLGTTTNPGIETVRAFVPFISAACATPEPLAPATEGGA